MSICSKCSAVCALVTCIEKPRAHTPRTPGISCIPHTHASCLHRHSISTALARTFHTPSPLIASHSVSSPDAPFFASPGLIHPSPSEFLFFEHLKAVEISTTGDYRWQKATLLRKQIESILRRALKLEASCVRHPASCVLLATGNNKILFLSLLLHLFLFVRHSILCSSSPSSKG